MMDDFYRSNFETLSSRAESTCIARSLARLLLLECFDSVNTTIDRFIRVRQNITNLDRDRERHFELHSVPTKIPVPRYFSSIRFFLFIAVRCLRTMIVNIFMFYYFYFVGSSVDKQQGRQDGWQGVDPDQADFRGGGTNGSDCLRGSGPRSVSETQGKLPCRSGCDSVLRSLELGQAQQHTQGLWWIRQTKCIKDMY